MFFLLTFRTLDRLPIGIFEIFFLLVVAIVSFVSIREMVLGWIKGTGNFLQLILLPLFLLPFINAWQANQEFLQPYWMGLFAQRQQFIMFAGYFIIIALKKNWVSIDNLTKYFIKSLFVIMIIMLFFSVFVDPTKFSETEFVRFSLNKGWHYEFPSDVVANIIIYAMIIILSSNNFKYLIPLGLGVIYFLIYIQDRSQILMICITIGIYFLRNVNLTKTFYFIIWGSIIIFSLIGIVLFINPEIISHYITIFGNASTIVTGESTTEYSTNMRLSEGAIAIKGFYKHPWLGNGFVSSQFKGGFSGFFGYFYAADVGIFGNLFVYGILGTLVFYLPFIFAVKWARKTSE
ncbi:MAG: hypothetical protein IPK10_04275 [Bacteroidetes bacterium]|nr:hypothetical protein [Bacteroidota bacterium]